MLNLQFSRRQLETYNNLSCAGISANNTALFSQSVRRCTNQIKAKSAKDTGTPYVDGFCLTCDGKAICAPLGANIYLDHAFLFHSMLQVCISAVPALSFARVTKLGMQQEHAQFNPYANQFRHRSYHP